MVVLLGPLLLGFEVREQRFVPVGHDDAHPVHVGASLGQGQADALRAACHDGGVALCEDGGQLGGGGCHFFFRYQKSRPAREREVIVCRSKTSYFTSLKMRAEAVRNCS